MPTEREYQDLQDEEAVSREMGLTWRARGPDPATLPPNATWRGQRWREGSW